jgi:hypothetical protein
MHEEKQREDLKRKYANDPALPPPSFRAAGNGGEQREGDTEKLYRRIGNVTV